MSEIDLYPLQSDDIAGFNATVITLKGNAVGVCLKLRRVNGRDHLLHLRPQQAQRLISALVEYMNQGNHQGLMMQFHSDPSLASNLPPEHPFNTLLTMSPPLSPEEGGGVKRSTDVVDSAFTARGSFVKYTVSFAGGDKEVFRLHECIAFNIWGFIQKMSRDADLLLGEPVGRA